MAGHSFFSQAADFDAAVLAGVANLIAAASLTFSESTWSPVMVG
jgi:hypothetical protein